MKGELGNRVDFHVHYDPTNEQTAYDAIKIARERNVVAMTVLARSHVSENTKDFIKYGKEMGVDVVPGVEFLGRLGNDSVDFIFLGFDLDNENLKPYFGKGDNNKKIAINQKRFLDSKGFSFDGLTEEQKYLLSRLISGEISEKAINFCNIVTSLPQNNDLTRSLKEKYSDEWERVTSKYGNTPNFKDDPKKLDAKFLYNIFFTVGKEGYQEVRTDAEKIISVIHKAGGVALYSPEGKFSPEIWKQLQSLNIDGIMAWHAGSLGANGKNIPDIPRNVIAESLQSGLLVLGGSDYQQKDWELGIGNGNMYINPRRYEEFINYIKARNKGKIPWLK